jgi:hypothetical protein
LCSESGSLRGFKGSPKESELEKAHWSLVAVTMKFKNAPAIFFSVTLGFPKNAKNFSANVPSARAIAHCLQVSACYRIDTLSEVVYRTEVLVSKVGTWTGTWAEVTSKRQILAIA